MRRLLGLAVLTPCVLMLATPTGAKGTTVTRAMTIRLLSISGRADLLRDLPPRGTPSKGDVIAQSSVLRNLVPQFGVPKGAVVGGDYDVVKILSPHTGLSKTRVTLPGGTLRVVGRIDDKPRATVTKAVMGGTGTFAGARGSLYIRDLRPLASRRAINVYRLRLP